MDRIIREVIDIELHPNNMNREVGFCLSKSWKPLICSLKKNLRNMTPDPQGYTSRGMACSSGMRLLGHCSHGNLAFPFIPALACYLLDPHSADPSPLHSTGLPGSPPPFPYGSYIVGCICCHSVYAICSRWFIARGLLLP
jgi:hypothetical protein